MLITFFQIAIGAAIVYYSLCQIDNSESLDQEPRWVFIARMERVNAESNKTLLQSRIKQLEWEEQFGDEIIDID